MVFSSLTFLFYFLGVVLLIYYLVPFRWKNGVLLAASLFFYGWGEPKNLLVMAAAVTGGYFFGLLIERFRTQPAGRYLLVCSVVFFLLLLGFYKYIDFLIGNLNRLTGWSLPLLGVSLPIGISFYTFQLLGYTIDVYRGDTKAQIRFLSFATYAAMFPQLIAGPIVRYTDISGQLHHRTHSFDRAAVGCRRFLIGLSKKVLLADVLGEFCQLFSGSGEQSVCFFWMYAAANMLQIYFDFSGYSDMAIGLGQLFGFDFPENFRYPLCADCITDFWRRWHITLGKWFRDYVYIPLGGNRVPRVIWLRNLLIVWFLTGLWHGASWTFVCWGLFFGVILLLEKCFLLKVLKRCPVVNHLYVLLIVSVSFVLFQSADLTDALFSIRCMFGAGNLPAASAEFWYYLRNYGLLLVISAIGATPLPANLVRFLRRCKTGDAVLNLAEPIVLALLLLVTAAYLVDGSFHPFLYFRF
ncbi:MAG: MBOAT family O-acyltransferase [Fusicatenibacter sp.]|nr:MBOAT family protein [Lachnospiraceae bacterium]MDY2937200.1 MBOAT family O-acyltransferase [Fusicatenibacter sp.]